MIKSFRSEETEKNFNGRRSLKIDLSIQNVARRKLRMINSAQVLEDLRILPGNRLGKLTGDLGDSYSIRINDQWRIVFEQLCLRFPLQRIWLLLFRGVFRHDLHEHALLQQRI
ncbi:type II toxin-antitoxin system RelE/ParE family toxin [Treponema sp.]|uniref:type II toxin-antitoxin system RelE/ParE family toxin n=1 Tax=Treponema sp. TaxID=166 RepID=UPI003FD8D90C